MTYRLRNIVLAVGLALFAAVLTIFYITNYKRTVQQGETSVTVFVAKSDISPGTSGADARGRLRTERVERRNVVPGAIADPGQIEKLVAADTIYAGEQISTRRFTPLEQQGIRAQLKGNMRAIQIAGDPNQLLAGTLEAGDRIDIVAGLTAKGSGEGERLFTRIVLRDLLVLQAGETTLAASKIGSTVGATSVQLAVTDSQAQKLFFVTQNGSWTLQLRPVVDAADSPESVETIESVVADGLGPNQYAQIFGGR